MKTTLQHPFKHSLKHRNACALLGFAALVACQAAAAQLVINGDENEVTDIATKLIWRRCSEGLVLSNGACIGTASTYRHEQARVQARTQAAATGVAWRLPSVKELESILDIRRSNPTIDPAIDSVSFPSTPADYFWSSAPGIGHASYEWGVNFGYKNVSYGYRDISLYVRLVRDAQ
jgi:Protein of unknown function (DUF1566)